MPRDTSCSHAALVIEFHKTTSVVQTVEDDPEDSSLCLVLHESREEGSSWCIFCSVCGRQWSGDISRIPDFILDKLFLILAPQATKEHMRMFHLVELEILRRDRQEL